MTEGTGPDKVRLDRWLWAARFYKTRSIAAHAIDGGKVQLNGTRVKRSALVHRDDVVRIRKPPFEYVVQVRELAEHRGSASVAQSLFAETPESVEARERMRVQLRQQPHTTYEGKGRPTKKDRRGIERLKEQW
jgi:ribosome-associated heat shock protein Hsp15